MKRLTPARRKALEIIRDATRDQPGVCAYYIALKLWPQAHHWSEIKAASRARAFLGKMWGDDLVHCISESGRYGEWFVTKRGLKLLESKP